MTAYSIFYSFFRPPTDILTMSYKTVRYLCTVLVFFCLPQASSQAFTLDFDTDDYPDGNLDEGILDATINVSGYGNVDIDVTGNTSSIGAFYDFTPNQLDSVHYPNNLAINDAQSNFRSSGGFGTETNPEALLHFDANFGGVGESYDIKFTFTAGQVTDVEFTIADIDKRINDSNNWQDKVTVRGDNGVDSNIIPAIELAPAVNRTTSESNGVVFGETDLTDRYSSDGNAKFEFSQPIDSFTIKYEAGEDISDDPGVQYIAIHDITFQNVPFAFSPTLGLLLSIGGLFSIKYLKQRRRQKKLDIA